MDIQFPYNPTRVAFAGDWHGNGRFAAHAIAGARAAGAQMVVQLGDFGVWSGALGQRYLDVVDLAASRAGVIVAFIDGNHEDFDLLESFDVNDGLRRLRDGVWHIPRGTRWTWEGLRFVALGGGTSLDRGRRTPGLSWWYQEAVTPAQAEQVIADGPGDVFLTHDCPDGVVIPGIDRESSLKSWPERELRAAWAHRDLLALVASVVAPTHLLHGHFHIRYTAQARLSSGALTLVEGLADDGGDGNWIVVDLAEMAAESRLQQAMRGNSDFIEDDAI